MATWILVQLNLIEVAILFPPVPVVVFTDVVERHFQRIRAHAEVCIRQALAHRIDIGVELKPNTKTLGNVLHQIVDRALVTCLKSLRHSHRRQGHEGYQ